MGANSIEVYNLKELSLEDIHNLISKGKVFDIDQSLFTEAFKDTIDNHFFDTTTKTGEIL